CNNENFEIDTDYCLISNSSPIERFSLNSLSSKLSIENKPNSSSSSLESFPDKIPNPLSYSSVNPPYCSISSTVESNSDASMGAEYLISMSFLSPNLYVSLPKESI